ncbi:LAFA_0D16534g1_1 [Lachancea sp. 'fantastica']|nr:LAFA_0D16534g1_1 [Lachancea sp. 'fantastica']
MVAAAKHRKFGEESEALKDVPADIPEDNAQYHSSDSDSDSEDDDAPEEAGLSSSKNEAEKQESERLEALKREQELLKEKRRKQNSRFAEQQDQKRSKQMQDFEAVLKQREQSAQEDKENVDDDLVPDQLPEDFFDNLDEQEARQITVKPTHVNFNDVDDEDFSADVKAELQKQKKKTLRHLRKTTVKRGPVKVALLASINTTKALAPQKDSTVLNKKDKWLKRKVLGRKR